MHATLTCSSAGASVATRSGSPTHGLGARRPRSLGARAGSRVVPRTDVPARHAAPASAAPRQPQPMIRQRASGATRRSRRACRRTRGSTSSRVRSGRPLARAAGVGRLEQLRRGSRSSSCSRAAFGEITLALRRCSLMSRIDLQLDIVERDLALALGRARRALRAASICCKVLGVERLARFGDLAGARSPICSSPEPGVVAAQQITDPEHERDDHPDASQTANGSIRVSLNADVFTVSATFRARAQCSKRRQSATARPGREHRRGSPYAVKGGFMRLRFAVPASLLAALAVECTFQALPRPGRSADPRHNHGLTISRNSEPDPGRRGRLIYGQLGAPASAARRSGSTTTSWRPSGLHADRHDHDRRSGYYEFTRAEGSCTPTAVGLSAARAEHTQPHDP